MGQPLPQSVANPTLLAVDMEQDDINENEEKIINEGM